MDSPVNTIVLVELVIKATNYENFLYMTSGSSLIGFFIPSIFCQSFKFENLL